MKNIPVHHSLVSAMALSACIAVHANAYRNDKTYSNDIESDLFALKDSPLSPPVRVVSTQEREEAFQSGRVAFFKTTGAAPTLEFYDPLNRELKISTFDKNLLYLKPLSSKRYDLAGHKIEEDYFDSSAKGNLLDKAVRSTSMPEYASPFFMLYLKSVPTCLVLKDEKELSLLVAHMRMLFERAGLTPSLQKPLLVVSTDGKTTELTGLFADADFLHKYFYLASFADEGVQKAFLDSHKEMAEYMREVNTSASVKYPKDGFFGGVVRSINENASGFNMTKLAVNGTSGLIKVVGGCIVAGLLVDPVKNWFVKKAQKGVEGVTEQSKAIIEKTPLGDPERAALEKEMLKLLNAKYNQELTEKDKATDPVGRLAVMEKCKKLIASIPTLSDDELLVFLGKKSVT